MAMTKAKDALCIKVAVVTGATAATNIAVTGIATEDTLISVIEHNATSALPTDRTATTSITSAGNIQCSATTSADSLVVLWLDNSA